MMNRFTVTDFERKVEHTFLLRWDDGGSRSFLWRVVILEQLDALLLIDLRLSGLSVKVARGMEVLLHPNDVGVAVVDSSFDWGDFCRLPLVTEWGAADPTGASVWRAASAFLRENRLVYRRGISSLSSSLHLSPKSVS